MSNVKHAIKRTLTFLLAFAMVVTSLYVAPVREAKAATDGLTAIGTAGETYTPGSGLELSVATVLAGTKDYPGTNTEKVATISLTDDKSATGTTGADNADLDVTNNTNGGVTASAKVLSQSAGTIEFKYTMGASAVAGTEYAVTFNDGPNTITVKLTGNYATTTVISENVSGTDVALDNSDDTHLTIIDSSSITAGTAMAATKTITIMIHDENGEPVKVDNAPVNATNVTSSEFDSITATAKDQTTNAGEVDIEYKVNNTAAAGDKVAKFNLLNDSKQALCTVTLKLTVSPANPTITYMVDGAANNDLTPETYPEGTGATLPDANAIATAGITKSGYIFDKWVTESDGNVEAVIDTDTTGNQTVYLKWKKKTVNVSYEKNLNNIATDDSGDSNAITAASADPENNVDIDTNITLPDFSTLTLKKNRFIGWFDAATGGDKVSGGKIAAAKIDAATDGTIRLYAHWAAVTPAGTVDDVDAEDEITVNLYDTEAEVKSKLRAAIKLVVSGEANDVALNNTNSYWADASNSSTKARLQITSGTINTDAVDEAGTSIAVTITPDGTTFKGGAKTATITVKVADPAPYGLHATFSGSSSNETVTVSYATAPANTPDAKIRTTLKLGSGTDAKFPEALKIYQGKVKTLKLETDGITAAEVAQLLIFLYKNGGVENLEITNGKDISMFASDALTAKAAYEGEESPGWWNLKKVTIGAGATLGDNGLNLPVNPDGYWIKGAAATASTELISSIKGGVVEDEEVYTNITTASINNDIRNTYKNSTGSDVVFTGVETGYKWVKTAADGKQTVIRETVTQGEETAKYVIANGDVVKQMAQAAFDNGKVTLTANAGTKQTLDPKDSTKKTYVVLDDRTEAEYQAILQDLIVINEWKTTSSESTTSPITTSNVNIEWGAAPTTKITESPKDGYLLSANKTLAELTDGTEDNTPTTVTITVQKYKNKSADKTAGATIDEGNTASIDVKVVKRTAARISRDAPNEITVPSAISFSTLQSVVGLSVKGYKVTTDKVSTGKNDYVASAAATSWTALTSGTEGQRYYKLSILDPSDKEITKDDDLAKVLKDQTSVGIKASVQQYRWDPKAVDPEDSSKTKAAFVKNGAETSYGITLKLTAGEGLLDNIDIAKIGKSTKTFSIGYQTVDPENKDADQHPMTTALYEKVAGNFTAYKVTESGKEAITELYSALDFDADDAGAGTYYVWTILGVTESELAPDSTNNNPVPGAKIRVDQYVIDSANASSRTTPVKSTEEKAVEVYVRPKNGTPSTFTLTTSIDDIELSSGESMLANLKARLLADTTYKVWNDGEEVSHAVNSTQSPTGAVSENFSDYLWYITKLEKGTEEYTTEEAMAKALADTKNIGAFTVYIETGWCNQTTKETATDGTETYKPVLTNKIEKNLVFQTKDNRNCNIYFDFTNTYTIKTGQTVADAANFNKDLLKQVWYISDMYGRVTAKTWDLEFNPVYGNLYLESQVVESKTSADKTTKYEASFVDVYTYSGKAVKPAPIVTATTVKTGDVITLAKKAYSCKYYKYDTKTKKAETAEAVTPKDAGDYAAVITIKGDSTEIVAPFVINKKNLSDGKTSPGKVIKKGKTAASFAVFKTLKFTNGAKATLGKDFTYTIVNSKKTKVGDSTAKTTLADEGTYNIMVEPVKDSVNFGLPTGQKDAYVGSIHVYPSASLVSSASFGKISSVKLNADEAKNRASFSIKMGDKQTYTYDPATYAASVEAQNPTKYINPIDGTDEYSVRNNYIYDVAPVTYENGDTDMVATPVLQVSYQGKKTYGNLNDIDTVKITVRGVDAGKKYYGLKEKTYKIVASNKLSSKLVKRGSFLKSLASYKNVLYDGSAKTLEAVWLTNNTTYDVTDSTGKVVGTAKYEDKDAIAAIADSIDKAVYGQDYLISYQKNKTAGKATAIITALPGSGWTGTIKVSFTIKKPDFKANAWKKGTEADTANNIAATDPSGRIDVQNATELGYLDVDKKSYEADKQGRTIIKDTALNALVYDKLDPKGDGTALKVGTDFTVKYKYNRDGSIDVTLTGKGSYTGKATFKLTNKPAAGTSGT